MSTAIAQETQPFDVAWRTIDGLKVRYATGGNSGERIVLFSPWPESILHSRRVERADASIPGARHRPSRLRAIGSARGPLHTADDGRLHREGDRRVRTDVGTRDWT